MRRCKGGGRRRGGGEQGWVLSVGHGWYVRVAGLRYECKVGEGMNDTMGVESWMSRRGEGSDVLNFCL